MKTKAHIYSVSPDLDTGIVHVELWIHGTDDISELVELMTDEVDVEITAQPTKAQKELLRIKRHKLNNQV